MGLTSFLLLGRTRWRTLALNKLTQANRQKTRGAGRSGERGAECANGCRERSQEYDRRVDDWSSVAQQWLWARTITSHWQRMQKIRFRCFGYIWYDVLVSCGYSMHYPNGVSICHWWTGITSPALNHQLERWMGVAHNTIAFPYSCGLTQSYPNSPLH